MKLIKAHVTNYRSIEDSGEFSIDNILCLVGKNEAGKSSILYALAGLNPHDSTDVVYDIEKDYPRRYLSQYKEQHPKEDATVVKTVWTLDLDEIALIEKTFGKDFLTANEIVISRKYKDTNAKWVVSINVENVLKHLTDVYLPKKEDKLGINIKGTTADLISSLIAIAVPSDPQKSFLAFLNTLSGKQVTPHITGLLKGFLPKFMYFSHYDRMDGQIRIDTFQNRRNNGQAKEGEQVFIDFLEFAGTTIDEILNSTTYEGLNAKCEAASNNITDQLLEYWTQNPSLEIEVRVTKAESGDEPPFDAGVIARARVKNNLHKVTVPFSERSAGFIWFFSFLVKFAQVRKDEGSLLLLLDEPGLTLHGKAQADLLRYFEDKLVPFHQVIFSTHSPFMVPTNKFDSIKVVEDKISQPKPGRFVSEGTKVREDALAIDRDTLFPLQGALGYELTQSLFIGKNTLLLEGPSDILYLQALSSALQRRNRISLDPRWTLCPAGGIDKIQPFVSLFSGAKLEIAALTDYSKKDSKKLEGIIQNRILESDRLLNFATLLGVDEADVEDVISPELFVKIINEAFGLEGANKATVENLIQVDKTTIRQVKKAETYFNILPGELPLFDHFKPAMWLLQNPKALDAKNKAVDETLDNAEKIIIQLNAIIK